jgi:glycolate oxidase FAD binding subunit
VVSGQDTVTPATAAEAAGVLRTASEKGQTVTPRGSGSKSAWGGPPSRVDVILDTQGLAGVTSHEPGDLVVTVGAGTQLRDVQATLGLAGQRLALEAGFQTATVGGVLATGEAGPLRLRYGTGRDLLIGVEFVRADGVVARSGGRVVKNVAGYDLGRLMCGSFGTLGVITSATFRLHPLPALRAWVCRPFRSVGEMGDVVGDVVQSALNPAAVEVDLAGSTGTLAVLLEGSAAGVVARSGAALRLLGGSAAVEDEPGWWGRYPFGTDNIALKLAAPVAHLDVVLAALRDTAGSGVSVRGSAGAGVIYAGLSNRTPAKKLESILNAVRGVLGGGAANGSGSCVVLTAPRSVREAVDVWGPVPGISLMRRIKDQFDPQRRLAPGRFVGGI